MATSLCCLYTNRYWPMHRSRDGQVNGSTTADQSPGVIALYFCIPFSSPIVYHAQYSSLGALVVIAARKMDQLTATAEEIQKLGGRCDTMQINIRDPVKTREMVEAIVEKHGKLTCLVVSQT